jgi:ectoine hydroxylase-related dioxygenase (phytanoyl-CoA dioxygenase family)
LRHHVAGDFAWGKGGPLCRIDRDPLLPRLGSDGYIIVDLPAGYAELVANRIAALLGYDRADALESYHRRVDPERHQQIIEKTRELRFADLGINPEMFAGFFREVVPLSADLPVLGRDHVQLRINRPGTTDYNPPHRDAALPLWANALNVWMPIAGVDATTSLPVLPGSHRLAEAECWQTKPGGAVIGNRPYRVPAVARLRHGALHMVRAKVVFGQALVFTPYLIHGLAVNQSNDRTRSALELRFEVL